MAIISGSRVFKAAKKEEGVSFKFDFQTYFSMTRKKGNLLPGIKSLELEKENRIPSLMNPRIPDFSSPVSFLTPRDLENLNARLMSA